jgi:hypothetical protein
MAQIVAVKSLARQIFAEAEIGEFSRIFWKSYLQCAIILLNSWKCNNPEIEHLQK